MQQPMFNHTTVIGEYQIRTPNGARIPGLTPCCAPKKMSAISMYYWEKNQLIKKDVPNMVVESCGCA